MKKLYKRSGDKIHYAEAWVNDGQCVHHWGVVGDPGQSNTIAIDGEANHEEIVERTLRQASADGYAELPDNDQFLLVITYETIDEWGSGEDLEKRHLVEKILNETLGWTGNGFCDGGDIGSGEMSIFSYVVDIDLAIESIFVELGEIGLLDGATVQTRRQNEEEYLGHPIPDEYANSIFNEPEEEIVPPTNQEEWENESNPQALRAALTDSQLDARRCRLYAVGCCRRIWNLMMHEDTRVAIEFVESLADGHGDASQFEEVTEKAGEVFGSTSMMDMLRDGEFDEIEEMGGEVESIKPLCELADQLSLDYLAVSHAAAAADTAIDLDPKESVGAEMCAAWAASSQHKNTTEDAEQKFQCDLIRCIFESPFKPPAFDANWKSPDIVELANRMYESKDFSQMPTLGQLLQRNGCTDDTILAHCNDDNHTRGCWLVDWCRN